jgi:hypothetical protein
MLAPDWQGTSVGFAWRKRAICLRISSSLSPAAKQQSGSQTSLLARRCATAKLARTLMVRVQINANARSPPQQRSVWRCMALRLLLTGGVVHNPDTVSDTGPQV